MRLSLLLAATFLSTSLALAAERKVTDDVGREITLPEKTERIVVMHEPILGVALVDLGINPVGSYGRSEDGVFLAGVDFIDVVLGKGHKKPTGIGAVGQVDLEKLQKLKPDLILGTELDIDSVNKLSAVAPVYLEGVSDKDAAGFGIEKALAKLLGKEETWNGRHEIYQKRVDELRLLLSEKLRGKSYLAIFLTDQINMVGDISGASQALKDLGLKRISLSTGQQTSVKSPSTLFVPLSSEIFGQLDPDLLIIMSNFVSKNRGEQGAKDSLSRILPGWSKFLKPVVEGRVVYLDPVAVTTPTIPSAMHTLDAIQAWAKQ